MKRFLDVVASFVGLIVVSPLLAVVAVLIKLDSSGAVLFKQRRVGRNFHRFTFANSARWSRMHTQKARPSL